jgi:hypothetical protein
MAQQETTTAVEKSETAATENEAASSVETEATESTEAAASEVTEPTTYTKEEYEAAVKKAVAEGVEATIEARLARERVKTKAAEDALAEQIAELDSLKESSSTSEKAIAEAKQNALFYELAYDSQLPLEDLEPLKELPEAAFRASVATIIKAAGKVTKAPKSSFNELFDKKDFTKPPAAKDFADGIFP